MSNNATHTDSTLGLLHAENHAQYLLHAPREIAFVLRQLASKGALVTAMFGSEQDFLLTTVINVSEDYKYLLLDLGRDQDVVTRALHKGRLLCDTQLDRVKVQFELERIEQTTHEHLPALRAPLPGVLLRLQRREYYRLAVPYSDDMLCSVPLESGRTVNARVIDISGGGLALMVTPTNSPFTPGLVFKNCSLTLPHAIGPVRFTLEVRNLFRITQRDDREMIRAGCQFNDMPMTVANQIQRYILRAEQERATRGV